MDEINDGDDGWLTADNSQVRGNLTALEVLRGIAQLHCAKSKYGFDKNLEQESIRPGYDPNSNNLRLATWPTAMWLISAALFCSSIGGGLALLAQNTFTEWWQPSLIFLLVPAALTVYTNGHIETLSVDHNAGEMTLESWCPAWRREIRIIPLRQISEVGIAEKLEDLESDCIDNEAKAQFKALHNFRVLITLDDNTRIEFLHSSSKGKTQSRASLLSTFLNHK